MKKLILIVATVFLVFVVGSMIAFVVFPPVFVDLHNNSQRIPTDFDYGSWTGSTYKNDFFGFSITVPEDWYFPEKEELETISKTGLKELQNAGLLDAEEMERVTKITEISAAELFSVNRYSVEEAVEKGKFSPILTLRVQKVPENSNRAQYVEMLRQTLAELMPNYAFQPETNKVIGSIEFSSLEIELEAFGHLICQEQLIYLKNDFAVNFILTWIDDSDKEQLDAIMATLTWE